MADHPAAATPPQNPLRTTASHVEVRRAGPGDAAAVLAMVREIAAHEGTPDAVAGGLGTWTTMLARPDVVVLLAERDGEPAGYVSAVRRLHLWLGRDILGLDDLFVRAGYRDAGVGRLLMTELGALAAREGLAVRWEVREDNVAAQRFYRRLGADLRTKVVAFWRP
ncbi:GNAT family N-acetyltransferase [Blastococcus sp. MG754426]|uniref:GNAT family N-acetyltransferase n=1 Tax=unclassified Blastococcus TaxID=2619396 RepID=UPI001EEFEFAC|nr:MULTISPECIES: GNAT family N-acetyltransferase [unclassified Blastococcus]MCF6506977.1 GNAT family N-acetyltransferase [Blastococcus sp. MG754426]MCF6510994.1 GNAT family N-acetyltransferase [Blastococcus sp. MG754427]